LKYDSLKIIIISSFFRFFPPRSFPVYSPVIPRNIPSPGKICPRFRQKKWLKKAGLEKVGLEKVGLEKVGLEKVGLKHMDINDREEPFFRH